MPPNHPDWIIEIVPQKDPNWDGHGTIHILSGEEQDAIDMLEFYAAVIEQTWKVPKSMDWQNESGASVQRRVGKLRYAVRVDCFERDQEYGITSGAGWLLARKVIE